MPSKSHGHGRLVFYGDILDSERIAITSHGMTYIVVAPELIAKRKWEMACSRMASAQSHNTTSKIQKVEDPWKYQSVIWAGILRRRTGDAVRRPSRNYAKITSVRTWKDRIRQFMSALKAQQTMDNWQAWAVNTRANLSRRAEWQKPQQHN